MKVVRKMNLMPKNKTMATIVQLSLIFGCLQLALPATLAVFPQTAEFDVCNLEPQFQHLVTENTKTPITKLYAQKGL